ncbi:CDP-alcohol phosphatidyltransferase family protein [Leclercia adecarboxylata ATCC 23216 = NBRC 102595]|uniref:CDP-alcohol phosphatidyltransferase family protein n=1 Tax=unclassified Leclercia TaxID=2627398 RepID=UPI001CE463F4|nr:MULTISPECIES: CDP-alcohol phosphatidyltransferase family protein [unclassified Leclercia]MCT9844016.1 CDP-alcohol phosphatidyltransferase family protein [Leclercia adecarboxylata ATCC 23216 = NBRC 102595]
MTLYQLKPAFQALLNPVMIGLYKRRVTPNHITLTAMALCFITGAVLILFPQPVLFVLLPVTLIARMALNALDGMLARNYNQTSRPGAILNEIGDVLSDIALYLPFILLPYSNVSLGIIMLFCAVMTEFCGVLAQTLNGVRSYAGPLGKSDRALAFGIWGLALFVWPQLMQWNNAVWGVAVILLLWTIVNRCRSALGEEG